MPKTKQCTFILKDVAAPRPDNAWYCCVLANGHKGDHKARDPKAVPQATALGRGWQEGSPWGAEWEAP